MAERRLASARVREVAALEEALNQGRSVDAEDLRERLRVIVASSRQDLRDARQRAAALGAGERMAAGVAADAVEAEIEQLRGDAGLGLDIETSPDPNYYQRLCSTPLFGLSLEQMQFPDTAVGMEAPQQRLALRNLGDEPAEMPRVGAAKPAAREVFPVYGESGQTLAPGETASIPVGFRPDRVGMRRTWLEVNPQGSPATSRVHVQGRGVPPSEKQRAEQRAEREAAELRQDRPVPEPRTYSAMLDLLRAARRMDEVHDSARAQRAVAAVSRALHRLTTPDKMSVFARYGGGQQTARMSLGLAVNEIDALQGKLELGASVTWTYSLAAFEQAHEQIRLLTGEQHDSAALGALDRGSKISAGILGGSILALGAAPLAVEEGGLLLGAARQGAGAGWLWAARSPELATEVAGFGLATGVGIGEAGGIHNWARETATPEGALDLLMQLAPVYDAALSGRPPPQEAESVAHEIAVVRARATGQVEECGVGEGADRLGQIRRKGGEIVADSRDPVSGDTLWTVRTGEGETVYLHERGSGMPGATGTSLSPRVWMGRARARRAPAVLAERDARLAALVEKARSGQHVMHEFGRVVCGGGAAATLDVATLPRRGAGGGAGQGRVAGQLEGLPDTIAVGEGPEPWSQRNIDLGQPPGELAHPAHGRHQPGDLAGKVAYTPARAFSDAVALTRVDSGMATLRGYRVVEVSNAPDASWAVSGARNRITLEQRRGGRERIYLYARETDIATGIGPGRRLGAGVVSPDHGSRLEADGRLVYGDEMVGKARPAGRVLVSGGGGTGAWNAQEAAQAGAEVDWTGRRGQPRQPHVRAELADVKGRAADSGVSAEDPGRLAGRQRDLETFGDGMLPRNLGPDGPFANPRIRRRHVEIARLTPSEDATSGPFAGKPGKVHVEFSDGSSGDYDYVVVAHGPDATRDGGAAAITRSIPMHLQVTDDGFPVITSKDGSVRVLGAATWQKAWEPDRKDPAPNQLNDADLREWTRLKMDRGEELPPYSRGVLDSVNMAGRHITAANRQLGKSK